MNAVEVTSQAAKRRMFLEAAQALAKASRPGAGEIIGVCETLGTLLSDLTGEMVIVVPERSGASAHQLVEG